MAIVKQICEFGVIRNSKDYTKYIDKFNEIFLENKSFNDLIKFIESNSALNSDIDRAFSIYRKSNKQYIKVKNYVGIIETTDKTTIEILPKIYLDESSDEIEKTKFIFLKMLRHLKKSPFISINEAHLKTIKNFPMLEIFISTFLNDVEKLIKKEIKNNYIRYSENSKYLKGKLNVSKHIKYNSVDKSKFYIDYNKYDKNIAHNKLIKSTLLKIVKISTLYRNIYKTNKLLNLFIDIDNSNNIAGDFIQTKNSNRLFKSYEKTLKWAEIFLMNKSFTNFHGSSKNQAILYPMERIFEDYIGFLLKKYSNGQKIKLQDKSYFLVDNHKDKSKFRLKPDIVVEPRTNDENIVIMDTKWKLLDITSKYNYNIKSSDMYQLYAYGKKYSIGKVKEAKLILIYPKNRNFSNKLDSFIYEGDLILEVVPFDLEQNEEDQIRDLLSY